MRKICAQFLALGVSQSKVYYVGLNINTLCECGIKQNEFVFTSNCANTAPSLRQLYPHLLTSFNQNCFTFFSKPINFDQEIKQAQIQINFCSKNQIVGNPCLGDFSQTNLCDSGLSVLRACLPLSPSLFLPLLPLPQFLGANFIYTNRRKSFGLFRTQDTSTMRNIDTKYMAWGAVEGRQSTNMNT